MKRNAFMFLIAVFTLIATAHAQKPEVIVGSKPGWYKIGENTVDMKVEQDQIAVLGADKFSALKFKVTDGAIKLWDITVTFENGTSQVIEVRSDLPPGAESKIIPLNDAPRAIKTISFIYKTVPSYAAEKSHLEVYGLK